jgi:drug/metabolite transporter (DMT)-like permease
VSAPPSGTAERRRGLGILAVGTTTLIWGIVPAFVKSTDTPPLTFAMWRLWAGAVVYQAILLAMRRRLPWATVRACALGGVLFACDLALGFTAWKHTGIANVAIISSLSPLLISFAAARWFGERFQRRNLTAAVVALGGVALVAVGSAGSPAWGALGDLLAAAGVLSWSSYWLFSKRARATVGPVEYMASVMLVAAATMTPLALLSGQAPAPPTGRNLAVMLFVVFLPGATGHTLIAWAHRHVEAWLAGLILQCQPVLAAVTAWWLLDESLGPVAILGGAVVLAATGSVVLREARAARAERVPEAAFPEG